MAGEGGGGLSEDSNGALEVGDELAGLLLKNGVGDHKIVVNTFANTNLGTSLVLEGAEAERKGGEAFVGLSEELARLVDLEVVHVLEFTLVDSSASIGLLGLALTSRDVNVKADDIAGSEDPLIDVSISGFLGVDNVVAINAELLDSVGENALNHVDVVVSADLVHSFGDFGVRSSVLDDALTSHHGVVGGKKNISLARLACANNNGVGSDGGEAVDVATGDELDHITVLDGDTLVGKG